tara:strand:+ start:83 stop:310 length:228 start_codon:yes stop_codon:yes gene_type:complete
MTPELSGTIEVSPIKSKYENAKTKIVFQEVYKVSELIEHEEIVFEKKKKEIVEEIKPKPNIDLSERRNRIKELKN